MSDTTISSSSNVLVTGVTGLIGGEIVRRIARAGLGKIWALVRPRDEVDARARFLTRLERSEESADASPWSEVEVLSGDITQPNWDLPPGDLAQITRCVDIIIHCAADTSFLCRPHVRDTNILGAQNLVDLAHQCRRRPLIVYMSTATNSGKITHRCLPEEEGCRPENEHHNDYTKSKAIAETFVRHSGLPHLVLRPTIVLSAGLPDQKFARNILWFVPLVRKFDCLPADPASRVDVVPVSFVAEATVALLQKAGRSHDCYHLSAGADYAMPLGQMCDYVNHHYKRRVPLTIMPPAEWSREHHRTYVKTRLQQEIFSRLRYYLPFLNMDVVYDNSRLRQELGGGPLDIPPVTDYLGDLLQKITSSSALQEAAAP
jgi:thioester reductase-like protein